MKSFPRAHVQCEIAATEGGTANAHRQLRERSAGSALLTERRQFS
jgi:hypothetical protein